MGAWCAGGVGVVNIPLRLGRGLNDRGHFMIKARKIKKEREATAWALVNVEKPAIPCVVTLTRVCPGGRGLDSDNLQGAFKAVRDQVAQWLGVDDALADQVRYEYAQARGPWGVRVEFGGMT